MPNPVSKPTGEQTSPEEARLEHLHSIAVDEYRFQVNLNWKRTQYFFALSAALLAVAANTLRIDGDEASLASLPIFVLGLLVALLAMLVEKTQKRYYQQARTHLGDVESAMNIQGGLLLKTTQGMGGPRRRTPSVGTAQLTILALIALINIGGIIFAIVGLTTDGHSEPPVESDQEEQSLSLS